MKLRQLAERIGGRISGNADTEITGVSGIGEARSGDITYLRDRSAVADVSAIAASAVIVRQEMDGITIPMLVSDNPLFTFAKALEVFHERPCAPLGVSGGAYIGSNVTMGNDVSVHPRAHVSDGAVLGSRVTLCPGTFVGEGVTIGDDSFIYPNVTIRENVRIGRKVIIHPGSVIGSDGYGYVVEKGIHYKIPQVGGVIIDDDVEIGACVCIDRATTGTTHIGRGTKIDNLVQIAHNVKIGKNCLIVAQVGIAGSVKIGDGAVIAGQAGIRDHITLGSRVMVGAQSGVTGDIPGGEVWSGTPAIPHKTWLRAQSIFAKLPEFARRIQELERAIHKEEHSDDEHP
ncbi:MAG: UDP-3-O-(3-hydroxymyristoyl)glucosamine N-acyltransferase [Nitrospiraceae bacterium]|nr:MAG: UDP-3-O-(3-hydroxymyristoyl)glucosamine N-acyltransferase [Nitrospiraceae bacterium]